MNQKLFIFSIAIIMAIVNGCHKKVFDAEAIGRDYFIENIPEGFDWSTISSVDVEITPNDQYDGQYLYTIEFFDKNPISDNSAALLATGWCSGKAPLQKSITLPTSLDTLFVCQTTPGNRRSVMRIPIENNKLTCNFSPINGIRANHSILEKNNASFAHDEFQIPDVPDNTIEITEKDYKLKSGNSYIIKKTYTGKLDFTNEKNITVFVTGIWNNTAKETKLETNTNIYIVDNGKVFSKDDWNIQVYSDSKFIVAKGCQLGSKEDDDISLRLNSGYFLNEGLVYMDEIKTDQANITIKNSGEFHLDKLEATNKITINNADGGKFYIDELNIGNATFINQCYLEVDEMKLNYGSSLTNASGCSVKCKELDADGTSITLASNSMFEVTEEAEFKGAVTNIQQSGGNDYALFKAQKIDGEDWAWKILKFSGHLYVECHDFDVTDNFYMLTAPAQLVDTQHGSLINISPSECSLGNNYVPEQPEQPVFPKQVTYNKNYTFASEDNYPSPGDYDLNDLVVDMDSITYYYEEKDKVSQIVWHMTLRAVGATRQLGAAIQLDEIKSENIASIIYSKNLPQGNFKINGNNTEKGSVRAVIPLFDNAHKALESNNTTTIVNTISNNPEWKKDVAPNSFNITITFTSPVDDDKIGIDKLNYFAIVGTKVPRTEIHLPKYQHTELSSAPKKLQEVTKDFMWTIKVPGKFRYAHEWTRITEAYANFQPWVQSGGEDYKNWYETQVNEDKLYKK